MSKPALAGVVFVLVILGALIYMSMNLARSHVRVEICMEFEGRTSCRTVTADTQEHAMQTGVNNACADIATGVSETTQCEHATPKSVRWLK